MPIFPDASFSWCHFHLNIFESSLDSYELVRKFDELPSGRRGYFYVVPYGQNSVEDLLSKENDWDPIKLYNDPQ